MGAMPGRGTASMCDAQTNFIRVWNSIKCEGEDLVAPLVDSWHGQVIHKDGHCLAAHRPICAPLPLFHTPLHQRVNPSRLTVHTLWCAEQLSMAGRHAYHDLWGSDSADIVDMDDGCIKTCYQPRALCDVDKGVIHPPISVEQRPSI